MSPDSIKSRRRIRNLLRDYGGSSIQVCWGDNRDQRRRLSGAATITMTRSWSRCSQDSGGAQKKSASDSDNFGNGEHPEYSDNSVLEEFDLCG